MRHELEHRLGVVAADPGHRADGGPADCRLVGREQLGQLLQRGTGGRADAAEGVGGIDLCVRVV
jgi:hypothetical protein